METTLEYKNDFDASESDDAEDHEITGQRVVTLWTKKHTFQTVAEQNSYFANPHDDHCLAVELDTIEGVPMFVFFYDERPALIEPRKKLPTEAELKELLETYG